MGHWLSVPKRREKRVLPQVHLLVAGFVCAARSPLNDQSRKHVGCCQKGEQDTGESWSYLINHIAAFKPESLLIEHVKELMIKGPQDCMSDAESFFKPQLSAY